MSINWVMAKQSLVYQYNEIFLTFGRREWIQRKLGKCVWNDAMKRAEPEQFWQWPQHWRRRKKILKVIEL